MATDLGKVGIVMKGTWSSSATYEVLDAVSYNGSLYIAKQAVPANTTPTNTTYWQTALQTPFETVTGYTITEYISQASYLKVYRYGKLIFVCFDGYMEAITESQIKTLVEGLPPAAVTMYGDFKTVASDNIKHVPVTITTAGVLRTSASYQYPKAWYTGMFIYVAV